MNSDRRSVRSRVTAAAALLLGVVAFAAPAAAQGRMFVSNYGTDTIAVYPRNANGLSVPLFVITNGLSGPNQIEVAQIARELFVANSENDSVTVYDADTGELKRTLMGASTGLYRSAGLAIDEINHELYVASDWPANSISVFDINANGNVAPKRTIVGAATGLSAPVGISVDLIRNEIAVANYDASAAGYGSHPSIRFFARTAAGNVAPTRAIEGALTGLTLPLDVIYDQLRDEVIVGNTSYNQPDTGSVARFPAGASGNLSPVGWLYGSNTTLCNPAGMVLDEANHELVIANSDLASGACEESVATFQWPVASENSAPKRRVLDANGASNGQEFPISVAIIDPFDPQPPDTTAPVVHVPSPIVLEATGPNGAVATFAVSATDNGNSIPVTCTRASGSLFAFGTTTVTCSATDADGNTGSDSFTVTVRDTIAPRITVPATIRVTASTSYGAVVTYAMPAISETGSGLGSASCTPASGATFPIGTTVVRCTATDRKGNVGTASFSVVVTLSGGLDGRMYGNGHLWDGRSHNHFAFRVAQIGSRDYGRLEFWMNLPTGCPRTDHEYDFDRNRNGEHDEDYGRYHRTPTGHFQATSINAVFSDDPGFRPDRTYLPTVDTVRLTGTGKWNGRYGYTFEAVATDRGEPGPGRDTFSLIVKDAYGRIVANVTGSLSGGNVQSRRLFW